MPAPHEIRTIGDLLALPEDGLRHELLDGEHVVTASPSIGHQVLVCRLLDVLEASFASSGLTALLSPADICLGPRTLVQPDLFAIRFPIDPSHATWAEVGVPPLAVEVISPASAPRDRGRPRRPSPR